MWPALRAQLLLWRAVHAGFRPARPQHRGGQAPLIEPPVLVTGFSWSAFRPTLACFSLDEDYSAFLSLEAADADLQSGSETIRHVQGSLHKRDSADIRRPGGNAPYIRCRYTPSRMREPGEMHECAIPERKGPKEKSFESENVWSAKHECKQQAFKKELWIPTSHALPLAGDPCMPDVQPTLFEPKKDAKPSRMTPGTNPAGRTPLGIRTGGPLVVPMSPSALQESPTFGQRQARCLAAPLGLAEHNPPLFQSQRSSIRFPLKINSSAGHNSGYVWLCSNFLRLRKPTLRSSCLREVCVLFMFVSFLAV